MNGKMPADVQIGGIFSLFDHLMVLLRFLNRVLLGLNVVAKTFVGRFILAPDFRYIFLDRRQFFEVKFGDLAQHFCRTGVLETFGHVVEPGAVFILESQQRRDVSYRFPPLPVLSGSRERIR